MKCLWNSLIIELFKSQFTYYRPQTKLREGYVFTGVCDSVQAGGWVSQHALQVSRPTPGGEVEGSGLGGLQAHTQGGNCGVCPGGSPGPHSGEGGSPGLHPGVSRPTPGGVSRHTPTPTATGYCCRWYASYWNAYL